jgi:hypothetical protein
LASDPAPAVVAPSSALALPSDQPRYWEDVRLQKLWLALQRREWRSLAVMATGTSLQTLPVAEMLAQIAWCYRGQPSCVFDLRDVSLRLADYQIREVHQQADAGARVLIALRSAAENPTAVLIAREADAVVLCVQLGTTQVKAAEQAIADVGRERVLGTIIVRPDPKKTNGAPGSRLASRT